MKGRHKKTPHKKTSQLPLTHALGWIVVSTLFITGISYSGFKYYLRYRYREAYSTDYLVRSIIQTGPQKEALKTEVIAEILGISQDHPPSALLFDLAEAKRKLLEFPLIARAEVKLIKPNKLYVDYTVRKPIAWLEDFENVVIDKEGMPFPFAPFFSPKNLPKIYLGLRPFGVSSDDAAKPLMMWGRSLDGTHLQLALELLTLVADPKWSDYFHKLRIDVSNACAESYGRREVVLTIEDEICTRAKDADVRYIFPRILRLAPKDFAQQLGNYLKLRPQLIAEEQKHLPNHVAHAAAVTAERRVIDFRIPQLAFIDESKR